MPDPLAPLREALQGRYAIERELGRGGMATVYLAQRSPARPAGRAQGAPPRARRHARPRALPPRDQARRAAAAPAHPHRATTPARPAGRLWFTMPYVEGETLRDRLAREGQLPVADAVRLTREAAQALDYAHRHGVVHRDIKPENILLVDGHALVADFGIARALGGGATSGSPRPGIAVGTPAYMSPEQAAGDQAVDARTDIYSLGCVLYEMLAGEPPFTGADRAGDDRPADAGGAPAAPRACARPCPRAWSRRSRARWRRRRPTGSPPPREFARALEEPIGDRRRRRPPRAPRPADLVRPRAAASAAHASRWARLPARPRRAVRLAPLPRRRRADGPRHHPPPRRAPVREPGRLHRRILRRRHHRRGPRQAGHARPGSR